MPWWAWLILGGGVVVYLSLVTFVCMFFRWMKKSDEEMQRRFERSRHGR